MKEDNFSLGCLPVAFMILSFVGCIISVMWVMLEGVMNIIYHEPFNWYSLISLAVFCVIYLTMLNKWLTRVQKDVINMP